VDPKCGSEMNFFRPDFLPLSTRIVDLSSCNWLLIKLAPETAASNKKKGRLI
jgi:hypothetical protein